MITRIKYTGTALPEDSDTETIYSTLSNVAHGQAKSGDVLRQVGARRCVVDVFCSHKGTLQASLSNDDGTNWRKYKEHVMPPTTAGQVWHFEFEVSGLRDFRLQWVNGGTTQTTFDINVYLTDETDSPYTGENEFPDYVAEDDKTDDVTGGWIQVGKDRSVSFHITIASSSPTGDGHQLQGTWDGGTTNPEVDGTDVQFEALPSAAALDDTASFSNVRAPFVRLFCDITGGTATDYTVRAETS